MLTVHKTALCRHEIKVLCVLHLQRYVKKMSKVDSSDKSSSERNTTTTKVIILYSHKIFVC